MKKRAVGPLSLQVAYAKIERDPRHANRQLQVRNLLARQARDFADRSRSSRPRLSG